MAAIARNTPSCDRFCGFALALKLDDDSSGDGMVTQGVICPRCQQISTGRDSETQDFSDQRQLTDDEKQQVAADDFAESIITDILKGTPVVQKPRKPVDLQVLLDLVGSCIIMNPKGSGLWRKRQMIAEKLGISAAINELRFTEKILSMDAANKCAWFQRKWVLQTFGGGEYELAFCNKLLEDDISNEYAWRQRFFALMRCGVSIAEVKLAINAISHNPEIEHPWMYLKQLYKEIKADPRELKIKGDPRELEFELYHELGNLFYSIIHIESVQSRCHQGVMGTRLAAKYLQMKIIEKRSKIVNALDALLDLMTLGYEPTEQIKVTVQELCVFTKTYVHFPRSIVPILEILHPLKALHWRRRADQVDKMRCDTMLASHQ